MYIYKYMLVCFKHSYSIGESAGVLFYHLEYCVIVWSIVLSSAKKNFLDLSIYAIKIT